jgi:hypothetical protein
MNIKHIDVIINLIHARIDFCTNGDEHHVAEYQKEVKALRAAIDAFALQEVTLEQMRDTLRGLEK